MSSLCKSLVGLGADGAVVQVECHLSNNLPVMVIVGFAGRAVNEAKDRLRGAFNSSQLKMPARRITINLAPADIPKTDSGLDLAIAISILTANQQIAPLTTSEAAIGELGLDGTLRPVRGIIGKLLAGRKAGITRFYVPLANLEQAQLVPEIQLYPVASLHQLYEHLCDRQTVTPVITGQGRYRTPPRTNYEHWLFDDVVGQSTAKRALIIAAAGGHNLILSGPPGTGKTMLAKSLTQLLPPLGHEAILEVTHLHSLASHDYERLTTQRPVRAPHHSASETALIGGGFQLRPGEISLSHQGVLLLDEFPEFGRSTLEALRQPLEDRVISISRAKTSLQFPADFMLLATANPCPCGYYGSSKHDCTCQGRDIQRYQAKLSGPIMDRIDLCCYVHEVDHRQLLGKRQAKEGYGAAQASQAIALARQRQEQRYGVNRLNNSLTSRELRHYARLSPAAVATIDGQAATLQLSARGYLRVVKVAQTIADLAAADVISQQHISEALSYRQRPAKALV